ncbi:hypothetical protein CA234_09675 [Sphingomonas sp. ABOLE]|uniref:hypothetical protein n=1 Tax=Sphingomonas sp. ABOLE TaxID=1985878 RepID=UPI000F7DE063|nr:hypothetical protein [Sphingomonas sp. ABOLE]RSV41527.1 hypothetical protein CA234_09675 [Sphingomonas sp. ABOLE]
MTKATTHAAEPATTTDKGDFGASGAPEVEVHAALDHPALDGDPRAGTTAEQNRIDFNDPHKPGHEVVEEALKAK